MIVFDLDDTLYKERDYVKSGHQAVLEFKRRAEPAFTEEQLSSLTWGDIEKAVYRQHFPAISLSTETEAALDSIKASGIPMAIITDGRSVQQRHKYLALGLDRWVPEERLLISEEVGAEKTDPLAFLTLMKRFPEEKRWMYVADNVAKDFLQPNRLGWLTAMLLDPAGANIHRQPISDFPPAFRPRSLISSLAEVLPLYT